MPSANDYTSRLQNVITAELVIKQFANLSTADY